MPALIVTGCWTAAPPAPAAAPVAARSARPAAPARAPAGAEFGLVTPDGRIDPAIDIPLVGGTTFGWRLQLGCQGMIAVREELRLPDAGDWGADPALVVSGDGRAARLDSALPCVDGWVEKAWTVTPGDPPGVWVLRVTAEGFARQTFTATFTRP